MDAGFQCAHCGEWNEIAVDHSQGKSQTYVEDCQICCKPNVLHLEYDPTAEEYVITAEPE
jgi:cysteine-rich CPXCG protein